MSKISIKPYTREELRSRGVMNRGSKWVTATRKEDHDIQPGGMEEIYILKALAVF